MKHLPTLTTALAIAAAVFTIDASAQTGCTTVEVHNVRPQQGFLMLAAYTDAESFNKKPAVSLRVPAGEAVTSVQLCGVSAPVIAIAMFQDLDSDGRMAQNIMRIPTEPWGSSGTPGAFGPTWETAKTALNGSPIVVRLSQ